MAASMSAKTIHRFSSRCTRSIRFAKCDITFIQNRFLAATATPSNQDPGQLFSRRDVQRLLQKITGFNLDKIFKEQYTKVRPPKYQLMTDAEVEKLQANTIRRGRWKLQMPPVLRPRDQEEVVIGNDPDIEGCETHKLVFTDITYGLRDKTRTIVVREPSGKLRHASSDERDRLLNVYFPQPGRVHHLPKMFTEPYLENLLNDGKYEYVLDRTGIQFEPDSQNYVRVCERVYEHIRQQQHFDNLRSTRHFGPMAFYMAFNNKIEDLLVDMIQRDLLNDAVDLIKIHGIIHRNTVAGKLTKGNPDVAPEMVIQTFAEKDASQTASGVIQLALQTYMETLEKVHNESM